jgi:hypothetical protein
VSDDYTQGQPFNAGNPYGTQGAATELELILERVKDERLRLIRLLKDCETRFGTAGVVPPAEEIARLTGKVRAIDDAVRNRYHQLRHDETLIEKRAHQVDQLRECVQSMTDQVDNQIAKAKSIKPDLEAARQSVQTEADLVLSQARSHVAQIAQAMADRLDEYRSAQSAGQEQLREFRREIEPIFKDIDTRLAAAAGLARDEAQKLIDPIFTQLENHATECGQRIHQLVEATDDTVLAKLEALPGKAEEALQPARETLDSVIDDARNQVAAVNDTIRVVEERVQALSGKAEGLIDQQLEAMNERAGHGLDAMLAERLADQQDAMDRQQAVFHDRLREQDEQFDRRMREQDEALQQREREVNEKLNSLMMDKQAELIVTIDEQTQSQIERLLMQHQDRIEQLVSEKSQAASDTLAEQIKTVMAGADEKAEDVAQQIKERLSASLDQSRVEAEQAVGRLEQQVSEDKDRLVTSLDQLKEQAQEVTERADRQASQVGEKIERSLQEQVVSAMSRSEAITEPFKARLEGALAEHRRLADEYSRTAETELTEKAKAHWAAFRHDTQAALDKQKQVLDTQAQATIEDTQDTLRQRVQDLCTSSQSMVELIEQQLTRRLKSIEPQTHQVVEAIEKQIAERLGQMRNNAESMVQLVEDQLTRRVADLQPKAVNAARDAERELNEHMDRVRKEVENVIAPLRRQVIEELGQIADVGKSVRGVIRHDTATHGSPGVPAGSTEPPVVDARKLTTPLQEMATRMGKKAAKLAGALNEAEQAATPSDGTQPDTDRKAA